MSPRPESLAVEKSNSTTLKGLVCLAYLAEPLPEQAPIFR